MREQVASNLIGQHVRAGDADVIHRIHAYATVTSRAFNPPGDLRRGEVVLDHAVRVAANTQAVMDGFIAIGFMTAVALLFVVYRSAAPQGPASPAALFPVRRPRLP